MASDRFGLPPLSEAQESEEARAERLALVAELIREIFSTAVEKVGEADARRLWVDILNERKRKRGRPRKSKLSGWDALLLEMYDALKADPDPETLVRHISIAFHQGNPEQYHSAQAVERRLRRLLADRSAGKLLREKGAGAIPRYKVIPRSRGQ
jgi:hypothetical protein